MAMSLTIYSDDVPCDVSMDSDIHYFVERLLQSPMSDIKDVHEFAQFVERSVMGRVAYHNNAVTDKLFRWPVTLRNIMTADVVSQCLIHRHHVIKIAMTPNGIESAPLAIYMNDDLCDPDDYNYGVYSFSTDDILKAVRFYLPNTSNHFMIDLTMTLRSAAPLKFALSDPDISPFKNGMLNRETRELIPYSPDYINTCKFATNYNPNATLPVIQQEDGTVWSPDMLLPSFTSDPEVARLLMEGVAMALRPYKKWDVMLMPYATSGNNGKGTYCQLIRNLLGEINTSGLNIQQTEQEFMLTGIESKRAIIGDENVVGGYLEDATKFKCLVTGDKLTVNVKYERQRDVAFQGIIIQCINELPKLRDRSRSFTRRIRIIDFDQSFMGRENKYIKSDYIRRPEVLEWFAKVAIDMDIDEISEPQSCIDMLNEYLAYNDPIRDFANEILPRYSWNLIPNTLAYEQYKSWMAVNAPNAKVIGRNAFIRDFTQIARETGEWIYPISRKLYPSAGNMVGPEYTIEEYNAQSWINNKANLSDAKGRCTPSALNPQYQGILRIPRKGTPEHDNFKKTYLSDFNNTGSVSTDAFMDALNLPTDCISVSVSATPTALSVTVEGTTITLDENIEKNAEANPDVDIAEEPQVFDTADEPVEEEDDFVFVTDSIIEEPSSPEEPSEPTSEQPMGDNKWHDKLQDMLKDVLTDAKGATEEKVSELASELANVFAQLSRDNVSKKDDDVVKEAVPSSGPANTTKESKYANDHNQHTPDKAYVPIQAVTDTDETPTHTGGNKSSSV